MKIVLQTRDLKSGESTPKPFDSEEAATAWLKDRPKFTEVLGLAGHPLPPEVNDRLKAALRPLDAEEKLLEKQLEAAMEEGARKRAEAQRKKEADAAKKHVDEIANAGPNQPMEMRYTYDAGITKVDPADPREISDAARQVVTEWVEERGEWVRGRDQVVGDAKLTVYPGDLPDGVSERIKMGTFVPVSAPKQGS